MHARSFHMWTRCRLVPGQILLDGCDLTLQLLLLFSFTASPLLHLDFQQLSRSISFFNFSTLSPILSRFPKDAPQFREEDLLSLKQLSTHDHSERATQVITSPVPHRPCQIFSNLIGLSNSRNAQLFNGSPWTILQLNCKSKSKSDYSFSSFSITRQHLGLQ